MPSWCIIVLFWLGFIAFKAHEHGSAYRFNLYTDPDSLMRLQQIRDYMAGQGWFDLHQYRMGLTEGTRIHWSRLADLGPLLLMLLVKPFVSVAQSELFAMTAYPLLLLLAMFASAVAVAKRIGGPETFLPALVALATGMNIHVAYVPGNIDHHNLQLIAVLWAVYGACGINSKQGSTQRDGIITGSAITITMIIGMETLPYTLALMLAIGIRWLASPRCEKIYIAALGKTLVIGTALASLVFMPRPWPWQYCDSFTPATAFLTLAIGLIFMGLAVAGDHLASLKARISIALVCNALLAVAMVIVFPASIHNAYPTDTVMVKYMFSHITEMEPVAGMIRDRPTEAILFLSMSPIILGMAAYNIIKKHGNWRLWLTAALPAFVALGITLWQVRAQFFMNGLVVPMAAALIAEWRAAGINKRLAGWLIFTPPLYYMLSIGLATAFHVKGQGTALLNAPCNATLPIKTLNRLPAGLMLAPLNSGPLILVHTHQRVLAGTYHRDRLGNLAALNAFAGSDQQARAIIKQVNVDYVLVCPKANDINMIVKDVPDSFMANIAHGHPPSWLQPLPGFPTGMSVYKLAP